LWEELGVGITPASASLFATFLAVTRDNVASSSYEKHASHTELSNKEMDAGSSAAWTVVEQFTFSHSIGGAAAWGAHSQRGGAAAHNQRGGAAAHNQRGGAAAYN